MAEAKQDDTRVLITGANRGIGFEFVQQLLKRGYNVIGTCRNPEQAKDLKELQGKNEDKLTIEKLEITNDSDIANVAKSIGDKSIDILILNAGIIGGKDDEGKSLRKLGTLNRADFMNVYNVNVVGPMLLAQALYNNVKSSKRKQIIGITSGMGSISDCGSNAAVPYRCRFIIYTF